MSKMTKKFLKWFDMYGILDDWTLVDTRHGTEEMDAARRICWRAYQRGQKDERERTKGPSNEGLLWVKEFLSREFEEGLSKRDSLQGQNECDRGYWSGRVYGFEMALHVVREVIIRGGKAPVNKD